MLVVSFWVLGLFVLPTPARTRGKARRPGAKDPLGVKDAKQFFRWYLGMKRKRAARGEFETEAAYRKRIPADFEPQKVIYFKVPREPGLKEYQYDFASKTLTLTAGGTGRLSPSEYTGQHVLTVLEYGFSRGRYVGQNAYGAKVVVEKYTWVDYDLVLHNPVSSSAFRPLKGPFTGEDLPSGTVTVALSPLGPEEARRLSRTYEVVVGVTLLGYEDSRIDSEYLEPKFDSPNEVTSYCYQIDGYLREVMVRDRSSRAVVKTLRVKD